MAYVMNPYSYKLGYSLSWSDDWFSNKKLYPLILQLMLTIRYFLIFFWTSRNIEKLDTYLSHINLTLNSGRLLINLFFYEAKMNQPGKYKYKILQSVIKSIPFSDSNPEFTVKHWLSGKSIGKRTKNVHTNVKKYFFIDNSAYETIESQRFFLFFHFLGLDPASFLLEFYVRYGKSRVWEENLSVQKYLKYVAVNKRGLKLIGKGTPFVFIYHTEFLLLNRIYNYLNQDIFFFWLYDRDKNLNMIRFLRTLFFYGGMAYLGKRYAPLMKEPRYLRSRFPILDNVRKSKKYNNFVNIVKKKKKKRYKNFLFKLQLFNYFSLLNINYTKLVSSFKKKFTLFNLFYLLRHCCNIVLKQKKKELYYKMNKLPKNKLYQVEWLRYRKYLENIVKIVYAYRRKKMKLIEKNHTFISSNAYIFSQRGSTKFDSWGGAIKSFRFGKSLKSYEFLIDSLKFTRSYRNKKRKIKFLTRYNYYRVYHNYFGNYKWRINGNSLNYYISIPKTITRYVFFNKKLKYFYDRFVSKALKSIINFDNILNKFTSQFIIEHTFLSDYLNYKHQFAIATKNFLELLRSKHGTLYKYFWDFRKIYPKIFDVVHYQRFSVEYDDILNFDYGLYITDLDTKCWKIYDKFNTVFSKYLGARVCFAKYEALLNKYLKYKKNFYNYKLGYIKKSGLYKTNKVKNVLLWKSKYWFKFKKYNEYRQYKGEFVVFNRYFNPPLDKKYKTYIFFSNGGIFNSLEKQNNIYIKNWFKNKDVNFKKFYIKRDYLVNNNQDNDNFSKKKYILEDIRENYIFVDKTEKNLNKSLKLIKNSESKNFLNLNVKNFYKFLKKKKYSKNFFLKKNYKFLKNKKLKKNISFQKKLLKLEKHINYLKKLNIKKRFKIISTFFKVWMHKLKKLKAKQKIKVYDDKNWFLFVFKGRDNSFKWKNFKVFLRRKEKLNWYKLYKFLKYHTLFSSFDFKSVKKKIKNQGFSRKLTGQLISKFASILDYRRAMLKKMAKYPRYGLKLHYYFNRIVKSGTTFTRKVYKAYKRAINDLRFIRFSYSRLFFIFWFISLKNERNFEPKEMFLNKHYGRDNLYDFGSLLFLYLLKKPFYDFFSYYIKSILKYWLGISLDFNYIIITNDELSAQFIATHIARALHFGYKWREVIKPIRKDLKYMLTKLRVLENRPRNKYFTKYESYDNYENTLYEYSFIYIKLHIKNYLNSFKYFLNLKKFLPYIKKYYTNLKFSFLYKYNKLWSIIYLNQRLNSSLWSFSTFTHIFFRLKYYFFFLFLKVKENFIYLKYNFIRWIKNWKKKELFCYFNKYDYNSFINVNKLNFCFYFLKKNKNFLKNKKYILHYYKFFLKKNLYNNFFFLWKHKKQKVYKYFFTRDKKIILKSLDDLKKINFGSWEKAAIFCKKFYKSKLYEELSFEPNLLKKIKYELTWLKVWKSFVNNPVLVFYFRFDTIYNLLVEFKYIMFIYKKAKIRSYWLHFVKLLKQVIEKYIYIFIHHFSNYINLKLLNLNSFEFLNKIKFRLKDNSNSIKMQLTNHLINYIKDNNILLKRFNTYLFYMFNNNQRNLINYKIQLINYRLKKKTYKYKSFFKPYGWLYFFLFKLINRIKKPLKRKINNYLFIFLKIIIKFFINKFKINTLILNYTKLYKIFSFIKNFFYFIFFKNYDFFFTLYNSNINNIKSYYYYFFFKNFYFLKYNFLLSSVEKKTLFFTQFVNIYKNNFILYDFNHICYLPDLNLKLLLQFKKFDWNLLKIVERGSIFKRSSLPSKYSAITKKKTFVDYFYQNRFLLGYKIRFAGRFKRKRKRSIMWLKRGLIPITAHDKWIDYGDYEIAGEFSQYSVRIWLNKNKNVKYKHYLKF